MGSKDYSKDKNGEKYFPNNILIKDHPSDPVAIAAINAIVEIAKGNGHLNPIPKKNNEKKGKPIISIIQLIVAVIAGLIVAYLAWLFGLK